MKFQLWSRDEYGQGSILFTGDLSEVMKKANTIITDTNGNNAVTVDDKENNWDMYFPIISSQNSSLDDNYVFLYGGRGAMNKEIFYKVNKKDGTVEQVLNEEIKDLSIRIYLGDISTFKNKEADWYATNKKRKEINSLDDSNLEEKTMLFVKVID